MVALQNLSLALGLMVQMLCHLGQGTLLFNFL